MPPKFPSLDWPTFISALSHLISCTSLPLLTHLVLHHLSFHYPATLTLIQVATTAICLWFWTIFGLYKLRTLSLTSLIPLAISSATLALLSTFTLASTSILLYQTARLLSPTLVLAIRLRHATPAIIALISSIILVYPAVEGVDIAIAYTIFAFANTLLIHPLAISTPASELQLQVLVKSLSSIVLITALPLDHYSSSTSILNFSFDETATILICSTGLLAFFCFVSTRASIHRLEPQLHNWLTFTTSISLYASHFLLFDHPITPYHVIGILGLSSSWLVLAECRRLKLQEKHEEQHVLTQQQHAELRGSIRHANVV